jgi:hypothetical protein
MINETHCEVEFQGQKFVSGGAYVDDLRALVYVQPNGSVTTWSGRHIGTYSVVSEWKRFNRYGEPYTMTAIKVTLNDGRVYRGRYGSDWSNVCSCRRSVCYHK